MERAYRRPVEDNDLERFLKVIRKAMDTGASFQESMLAGYSAVLCSPHFVTMSERPGRLDNHALAARLSYFLTNSEPMLLCANWQDMDGSAIPKFCVNKPTDC